MAIIAFILTLLQWLTFFLFGVAFGLYWREIGRHERKKTAGSKKKGH